MARAWCLVSALVLAACNGGDAPPLSATDTRIFAPLPGSAMAVAYLTIENRSGEVIELDFFESPDFERVELHETEIQNDTARMRRLAALTVPPRDEVMLTENGKHLMLIGPRGEAGPGRRVKLHIGKSGNVLLVIEVELQGRDAGDSN
ncbi:MAG: copper chaperone PCu(A)C [Gammaproteobacteria bacterium]|nr:copper chaperone PCu(A)C [Gammaproteobacteria bacterium]MDH4254226.1 copper chaperone PCu(A)C [Gammaproteobacteria bacterium]MDH5310494.1 copper chaperone PCu(A)C [Gammaproteobacteria bacterium]